MATIDQRRTRDGRTRYRVRVRRRGVSETATFCNAAEAREWAREVEQGILQGRRDLRGGEVGVTFDWVLDQYLKRRRPGVDVRRQLAWWRRALAGEPADAITSRRLIELRRQLLEEENGAGRRRSPATVNRYTSAISGLYSWAVNQNYVRSHPAREINALPEAAGRVRCLSSAERESLLVACRETGGLHLETLVLLGLCTGARRGELLGLRWSDLNAERNLVRLRGGGGLRSRELPVPLPVMERLGRLARVRRIGCDEVFADVHGEVRFPRAAWRAALDRAGIDSFRFQDLRHTMAAHLARRGAGLAEIAQVLGARNLESVKRYAPLVEPSPPAAIGLMHEDLFDL